VYSAKTEKLRYITFPVTFRKIIVSFEIPDSHSEIVSRRNVHVAPSSTPNVNVSCAEVGSMNNRSINVIEIANQILTVLFLCVLNDLHLLGLVQLGFIVSIYFIEGLKM